MNKTKQNLGSFVAIKTKFDSLRSNQTYLVPLRWIPALRFSRGSRPPTEPDIKPHFADVTFAGSSDVVGDVLKGRILHFRRMNELFGRFTMTVDVSPLWGF